MLGGRGFVGYLERNCVPMWACAILPDHVHLVTGCPAMTIEQFMIQMKGAATESLKVEGLHPFGDQTDDPGRTPKCFACGVWKVYLDPPDVTQAILYAENNPLKEGKLRQQQWSFVTPYQP
ncbi:hypothetical protein BH11PLA2_BH11PLA2_49860 [soil metagenome]